MYTLNKLSADYLFWTGTAELLKMATVRVCRQSCTNPSWTMFCLAIRALNGSLLNAYQLLDFTLRSWACHDEACQFGDSMILWSRGRTKLILITIQKHKLILCKWSMANATQKNQSRTTGKSKVGATVLRTSSEFLQSTLYNSTVCWSLRL